jgi:hypothetical protein
LPKYFQAIDDKQECVGIYHDGRLYFENFPPSLQVAWSYSPSYISDGVEYMSLYCGNAPLIDVCPDHLKESLEKAEKKLKACLKSFSIAKINFQDHCFFDLVPKDFLMEYLDVKTKITQHVYETHQKPENYDFLIKATALISKLGHQNLNLNNKDCRNISNSHSSLTKIKSLLSGPPAIDYNLFGTITGRLATRRGSFPILTVKKEFRKLIKPHNEWFVSLDYNGAEIRTFLSLSGHQQPDCDIHGWNLINVFKDVSIPREEAKTMFFSWFYNPDSTVIESEYYDRSKLLEEWYSDGHVRTPFKRRIKVEPRKALNYLIQSATSDLVIEKAVEISEILEGTESFISHIVHDEVVIDLSDKDRHLIENIKKVFAKNRFGEYLVNMSAGKNYYEMRELTL